MEEDYTPEQFEKEPRQKIKYRVGFFIGGFLLTLALTFDIAEIALAIFTLEIGSYVKDFAEFIVFPFLFWIFKIPFWKGNKRVQKIITAIITAIVSLTPILGDVMPELVVGVFITIMYSRIEDRLGIEGKLLSTNPNSKITRMRRTRTKIRG